MAEESQAVPPVTELPVFGSDAEAQQTVDEHLSALANRIETIQGQRQEALAATASATSRDGHIRVTVDSTGVPTDLSIARAALEETPDRLAKAILATAQQAAASVRTRMREAMDGIRDGDPELVAARAGAGRMLGGDGTRPGLHQPELSLPDVPRTASDPTGPPDPWAGTEASREQAPAGSDASFDEELAALGESARKPE